MRYYALPVVHQHLEVVVFVLDLLALGLVVMSKAPVTLVLLVLSVELLNLT